MDKRLRYLLLFLILLSILVAFVAAFAVYRQERKVSNVEQLLHRTRQDFARKSSADSIANIERFNVIKNHINNANNQQNVRGQIKNGHNANITRISADTSVLGQYQGFLKSITRLDSIDRAGWFFLH